jgi:tetratricopeptide (TPR) repeat protein
VRLGNVYARQQEYALARHVLGQALRLDPDDPKAYFNLGLAQEGLGEDEAALAAFRKATELNPVYGGAYYNLGTLLIKRKEYRAALEPLSEAVRLSPERSDPRYNLAVALAHLGETRQALDSLREALKLRPDLSAEAERDPDFQPLQDDPEFRAITRPGSSKDQSNDAHE